jgi:hypothetical protein
MVVYTILTFYVLLGLFFVINELKARSKQN